MGFILGKIVNCLLEMFVGINKATNLHGLLRDLRLGIIEVVSKFIVILVKILMSTVKVMKVLFKLALVPC